MKTKTKEKPKTKKGSAIESVTVTEKSVEVMFKNVRLIYDGISEVTESEWEGVTTYRFKAGIEIPESPEFDALVSQIRKHFLTLKMKGWSGSVAVEHFDEKKFKPSSSENSRLLYPSASAEELEDGGFRAKGKLFVNPSHDKFYAGCYVDVKVAFVANMRGAITIKDYLNAVRFAGDGEPISGAQDPWSGSQSKVVVKGVRKTEKPEPEKNGSPAKKKKK